jgi:hypothetical protein
MLDEFGPVAVIVPAGLATMGSVGVWHLIEGNRRLGWLLVVATAVLVGLAASVELLELYGILDEAAVTFL